IWTQRRKAIATLTFYLLTTSLYLECTFAVVVVEHEAGDMFRGILLIDIGCFFINDNSQFHLPIRFITSFRNYDLIVWPAYRVRCLEKQDGFGGHLGFCLRSMI